MEHLKSVIILILSLLFLISMIYHIYFRWNIRHITAQLVEIMDTMDTNQLLTVIASQREIKKLVSALNQLIKDIRLSKIQIQRNNQNFRHSITNISHDLRTPLTTADGYIQMLQSGAAKEDEVEYLAIISERLNMVKRLLEQLFEYVRIESGEITYEIMPVDAKKVFAETLAMYYDDFNRKGQEPAVYFPEHSCMIQGDERGLRRVFSNILVNAIVHGYGDYRFEIQESHEYAFTFTNKSEPMNQDDLDNIFERFYTKDQSRNKKTTGLGLAISKEITKRLNGKINAYYHKELFSVTVFFQKAE